MKQYQAILIDKPYYKINNLTEKLKTIQIVQFSNYYYTFFIFFKCFTLF